MKTDIIAACAQIEPSFGATARNIEKILSIFKNTNADLIVFPELATSGYEFVDREEVKRLSLDPENSGEIAALREACNKFDRHLIFGFPEKAGDRYFNSSLLIEPSGKISTYRKVQLFDLEKNLFDAGDSEPFVVKTEIGNIGMMICFDWLFPEIARILSLKGAQILAHPSNLVLAFCQRAMFARSVENGVFSMTCNRIGTESRNDRRLTFTGASQILSNKGETLAQAGKETEEVITATINPAEADDKMITDNNHRLNDRRVEMYGELIRNLN